MQQWGAIVDCFKEWKMTVNFKYPIGLQVWRSAGLRPIIRGTIVSAAIEKIGGIEYRIQYEGLTGDTFEWCAEGNLFYREVDAKRASLTYRIERLSAELAEAEMELAKLKEDDNGK